jgi:hypothetical protein
MISGSLSHKKLYKTITVLVIFAMLSSHVLVPAHALRFNQQANSTLAAGQVGVGSMATVQEALGLFSTESSRGKFIIRSILVHFKSVVFARQMLTLVSVCI